MNGMAMTYHLPLVANISKKNQLSPMASSEDEIMTLPEVADYLKVAERTLYRLAASKKIPAFKVGEAWRFTKSDIEAWIRSQVAGKTNAKKER